MNECQTKVRPALLGMGLLRWLVWPRRAKDPEEDEAPRRRARGKSRAQAHRPGVYRIEVDNEVGRFHGDGPPFSFWSSSRIILILSFLLWWVYPAGPMIAGYVGGRRAGSPMKAVVAALMPVIAIFVANAAYAHNFASHQIDFVASLPMVFSDGVSSILPFLVPYKEFMVTYMRGFVEALTTTFGMGTNGYLMVIIFSYIGGLIAEQTRRELVYRSGSGSSVGVNLVQPLLGARPYVDDEEGPMRRTRRSTAPTGPRTLGPVATPPRSSGSAASTAAAVRTIASSPSASSRGRSTIPKESPEPSILDGAGTSRTTTNGTRKTRSSRRAPTRCLTPAGTTVMSAADRRTPGRTTRTNGPSATKHRVVPRKSGVKRRSGPSSGSSSAPFVTTTTRSSDLASFLSHASLASLSSDVLPEMQLPHVSCGGEGALQFVRIRAFALREGLDRHESGASREGEAVGDARPRRDHGDAAEDAGRVPEVRALRGVLGHATDARRGRAHDSDLPVRQVPAHVARVLKSAKSGLGTYSGANDRDKPL